MERLCKKLLCKTDTSSARCSIPGKPYNTGSALFLFEPKTKKQDQSCPQKKENKRRNQIKTPANLTNPEQTIQMLPGTWRRADGLPETERQKQENKQEVFSIKKFLISRGPLRGPERKKPEEKAEPAQSRAEMMQMVVNFGRKSHPSRSFRATVTLK